MLIEKSQKEKDRNLNIEAIIIIQTMSKQSCCPQTITPTSTWLIKDRLIIGAFPDPETDYIETILSHGVNIFISLQTKSEYKTFRDYKPKVLKLNPQAKFMQFEIIDRKTGSDDEMMQWMNEIVSILEQDKRTCIYLHCHGGIGRTGNMAILLCVHYLQMSLNDSIYLLNKLYKSRQHTRSKFSIPQTKIQKLQIERLCK